MDRNWSKHASLEELYRPRQSHSEHVLPVLHANTFLVCGHRHPVDVSTRSFVVGWIRKRNTYLCCNTLEFYTLKNLLLSLQTDPNLRGCVCV